MIPRYTRPEMGRIWSDENKFRQWLEVELAASEALAEMGVVPPEAARALRAHAAFDPARILEIEKEVRHDVIAFTTAVAESMRAAVKPACFRRSWAASAGTSLVTARASAVASSTSSHARYLFSSLQMAPISGRV